ncbi:MAG: hypothetical protein A2511_10845 [Deltaproteobacteria bacterium RIFOXYD12_FULL_50_9]|nr:MAG: hypothetical protein A2511_10845 [Deltaproteobacteria bacterium RIFOXYD12_FULL_50_9]
MILQDIISDIHALVEDLEMYERKYGLLSETFYEMYSQGAEPEDESWVLEWSDWAGAYQTLLRRRDQYQRAIQSLQNEAQTLPAILKKAARHEPISVNP